MRIPKVGSIVQVEFLDHVQNHHEAISVVLYGKLLRKTDNELVIGSWLIDDDVHDTRNNMIFTILIPVIKSIKKLRM